MVKALTLLAVIAACHSAEKAPAEKAPPKAPPAASYEVHVDRRVELVSIVEWLAGLPEYQTAPAITYTADVKKEFAQWASHPVVLAAQQLRNEHGISYDAPMTLALSLDDSLHLRFPPPDMLHRFDNVDVEAVFLVQLRDFATQSKFDAFFAAHQAYFTKVEERMRAAITKENPGAWFDTFMGERPASKFTVVPAMLTGDWNYGPHLGGEIFQIIGVARPDFDEMPSVDDSMIELVVHEMAHSYVNPLLAAHKTELEPEASRLFAKVAEPMTKGSYGTWDIFLDESVVRAITSLYLRDRRNAAAADAQIGREEARAFLWTRPIAEALDKQRGHFAASVPKLVETLAAAK